MVVSDDGQHGVVPERCEFSRDDTSGCEVDVDVEVVAVVGPAWRRRDIELGEVDIVIRGRGLGELAMKEVGRGVGRHTVGSPELDIVGSDSDVDENGGG